jgi:hypothetical protein
MKKIFLIMISGLLIAGNLKAQYYFTDVTDTTISKNSSQSGSQSYAFDIDNDNIKDFVIGVQSFIVTPVGCSMTPATQTDLSCWVGTMPSFNNEIALENGYTAIVPFDSVIGANSHMWSSSQQNFLFNKVNMFQLCVWDSVFEGNWQTDTNAYIGLKFKSGADMLYGYLHVRFVYGIDSLNNYFIAATILDYAYNSIPDENIIAGEDIVIAVPENSISEHALDIKYNNGVNELTIKNNSSGEIKLLIYNASGQLVHSGHFKQENYLLEFKNYDNGFYTYKAFTNNFFKTGNFIKQ